MAEVQDFEHANFTWKGWPEDENRDRVDDLRAHVFENERGGTVSLSCWKLSWKERWAALWGGRVWLWIWGQLPPVHVHAGDPEWAAGQTPKIGPVHPSRNDRLLGEVRLLRDGVEELRERHRVEMHRKDQEIESLEAHKRRLEAETLDLRAKLRANSSGTVQR